MAWRKIEDSKLTAIADEIRELSGTTKAMNLDVMTSTLNSIPRNDSFSITVSGSTVTVPAGNYVSSIIKQLNFQISNEDALVARNITEYANNRVQSIGDFAFYFCTSLTSVSFPACTNIGSQAFHFCSRLTSVNFPACTNIGNYAFWSCTNLTSVSFPACTNIEVGAFYSCKNLTSVNFPACTKIGNQAFYCCYKLSNLTLGASTVLSIGNSNILTSTPYAGYSSYFSGTPYIYVPSSLVDAYKTARHWSYFSSYFSAIEDMDNVS